MKLRIFLFGFLTLFLDSACGYQALHETRSGQQLRVVAGRSRVARADAVQSVMAGARAELSRGGALGAGEGFPRLVVEVLRVDEKSTGIQAATGAGGREPVARGASVAVVGRAWVEQSASSGPSRDTGDVRRVETYAASGGARVHSMRHDAAVRAAAREVGRALARRALGVPEPDIEPM